MALNKTSKQNLEDFKSYLLIEKNFSKHTAKAYFSDVLGYLLWLGETSCTEVNFSKVLEMDPTNKIALINLNSLKDSVRTPLNK